MKVADIVQAQPVLQKIAEIPGLPLSLAYSLLPVMREAGEVAALFEKRRVDTIMALGTQEENSEAYTVQADKRNEFEAKIQEFLGEDLKFPEFKIPITALEPFVELSLVEVASIEWLLEA